MEMTSAALWLNSFFAGYDSALLGLMHTLADKLGPVLTPLMKLITLLGEKGIIFFLLAVACMCFSRTRKFGVCLFGAVCCGALITNIILKDAVARPRPFEAAAQFKQWWQFVGAPAEDGFSFPSGHVTAAAAGMTAISLMKGRKWIIPSVAVVLLMALSRNYLMAHYPSDVLFAAVFGVASGFIAWFITKLIFSFLERRSDIPLFALILDFNLTEKSPAELKAALTDKINGAPRRSGRGALRSESSGGRSSAQRALREEKASGRAADSAGAAPARRPGHAAAPSKPSPFKSIANAGYRGKHEKR